MPTITYLTFSSTSSEKVPQALPVQPQPVLSESKLVPPVQPQPPSESTLAPEAQLGPSASGGGITPGGQVPQTVPGRPAVACTLDMPSSPNMPPNRKIDSDPDIPYGPEQDRSFSQKRRGLRPLRLAGKLDTVSRPRDPHTLVVVCSLGAAEPSRVVPIGGEWAWRRRIINQWRGRVYALTPEDADTTAAERESTSGRLCAAEDDLRIAGAPHAPIGPGEHAAQPTQNREREQQRVIRGPWLIHGERQPQRMICGPWPIPLTLATKVHKPPARSSPVAPVRCVEIPALGPPARYFDTRLVAIGKLASRRRGMEKWREGCMARQSSISAGGYSENGDGDGDDGHGDEHGNTRDDIRTQKESSGEDDKDYNGAPERDVPLR